MGTKVTTWVLVLYVTVPLFGLLTPLIDKAKPFGSVSFARSAEAAIAIGHAQLAAFEGAVRFFDLGPLNDPCLVPSAIASTLGLLVQSLPIGLNLLADLPEPLKDAM